ncbi:hydroxyethylthiazole kinase [uncultured Sneathiella sp.]|uniref:hydroxyethylthiazole kinase n=1 Tax=uncultured Sneathiella sp. TaxID=879315 RepID=UPI002597ECBC|nr:hydroxyethylthiazole kinase [uncultured Sneathiella sp.]
MHENISKQLLQEMNIRRPAVHCLTNTVVQALTANTLLAVGAIPSMSSDIAEVADFTKSADALLVNIGTLDGDLKTSIKAAIAAARDNNIPWIFDPVFIDRSRPRAAYAKELLSLGPALIRGNKGEVALLGGSPAELARKTGAIVAMTGVTDIVTDGNLEINVEGGHELMSLVTGIGCAGTALLGACLAIVPPEKRLQAVAAGLSLLGEAGEKAATQAAGPGTFAALILDQIYQISQSSLQERKE